MSGFERMNTKDAINHVSETHNIQSMYQMGKELSDDKLTVTTTQIRNYLRGTRMSKKVADRFEQVFDITITDAYDNSALRRNYNTGV